MIGASPGIARGQVMEEVHVTAPYTSAPGSNWMHFVEVRGENWIVELDGVDSSLEDAIRDRYCRTQQSNAESSCASELDSWSGVGSLVCTVAAGSAVTWGSWWLGATPIGQAILQAAQVGLRVIPPNTWQAAVVVGGGGTLISTQMDGFCNSVGATISAGVCDQVGEATYVDCKW